ATIIVTSGNTEPLPIIDTPSATTTWAVGQQITFSGRATDLEDGNLPDSSLTWSLVIEHCATVNRDSCHEHHIQDWDGT
ncbi:hypothetical protein, partial [Salmonella sp. SAL4443]|uniref:hypothetical protein n=1 Tax=Salmonella sp. SAL4443 TaxID=3159898 RepID=UPI00397A7F74